LTEHLLAKSGVVPSSVRLYNHIRLWFSSRHNLINFIRQFDRDELVMSRTYLPPRPRRVSEDSRYEYLLINLGTVIAKISIGVGRGTRSHLWYDNLMFDGSEYGIFGFLPRSFNEIVSTPNTIKAHTEGIKDAIRNRTIDIEKSKVLDLFGGRGRASRRKIQLFFADGWTVRIIDDINEPNVVNAEQFDALVEAMMQADITRPIVPERPRVFGDFRNSKNDIGTEKLNEPEKGQDTMNTPIIRKQNYDELVKLANSLGKLASQIVQDSGPEPLLVD